MGTPVYRRLDYSRVPVQERTNRGAAVVGIKKNDKGDISPVGVKVGDRVLFGKYSGQTVKVDGEELLVMKEEDLFAVVEK